MIPPVTVQLPLPPGVRSVQGIGGDQFLQVLALLSTQKRRRAAISKGSPQNRIPAINSRKSDILGLDVSDYHEWPIGPRKGS